MADLAERLDRAERAIRELARQAAAKCWEDDVFEILDPKHVRDKRSDGG